MKHNSHDRSWWWKGLALLAPLTLIVAACGDDDDTGAEGTSAAETTEDSAPDETTEDSANTGSTGEPISIGVMLDVSGVAAGLAVPPRNAVQLLVDQINDAGGVDGRPIDATFVDSESTPDRASALARGLIDDGVVAVIGPSIGASCNATRELFEEAGIMQWCMSGAPFEWSQHFFAAGMDPVTSLGDVPARWMQGQGISEAACIATTDASGDAYKLSFEARAPDYDVTVNSETFASGDSSVETQLTSSRSDNLGAVYACVSGANLIPIVQGVVNLGLDVPVWSGTGAAVFPVADQIKSDLPDAGVYSEGSWVMIPDDIPADLESRDAILGFVADYEEAYGQPPDTLASFGADGLRLILEAVESGATTGTEIAKYVENLSDWPGFTTTFTFTPDQHRGSQASGLIIRFNDEGSFDLVEQLELP